MKRTERIIWIVLVSAITAADLILQLKGAPGIKLPAALINIVSVVAVSARTLVLRFFPKKEEKKGK